MRRCLVVVEACWISEDEVEEVNVGVTLGPGSETRPRAVWKEWRWTRREIESTRLRPSAICIFLEDVQSVVSILFVCEFIPVVCRHKYTKSMCSFAIRRGTDQRSICDCKRRAPATAPESRLSTITTARVDPAVQLELLATATSHHRTSDG